MILIYTSLIHTYKLLLHFFLFLYNRRVKIKILKHVFFITQMATHRDPSNFTFNDDELNTIEEHMEKNKSRLIDMNENLATDQIRVSSQNYALISLVAPQSTTQRSEKTCLKIRGVFNTLEEANEHASRLVKHDATFDIMVVSMYEWLLIPPDMSKINDQQYMDENLNGLISEYRKVQERTRIEFDTRKEGLKQNTHTSLC